MTIVIPCRNEKPHIEACLRSVLGQDPPPGGFEVIVADGMSMDGTRDILERLAGEDRRLRVLSNVAQMTAHGMNAGIAQARGRFIAIFGAHTEYASDYLRNCVQILEERTDAWCSGGPIVSRGEGALGHAVAAAMSHPLGIGNAKHRFPDYEGYAEGACFPVFRREVFEKIGLYDETLVRNQDDDLNYRLGLAGGRVFLSPKARCTYRVRNSVRALFRQYFQYGYWRVAVLRKHGAPASVRQVIPFAFFALTTVLAGAAAILPGRWRLLSLALPAGYAMGLGVAAAGVAARKGAAVGLLFPLAAAIMHVAYAIGFAWGVMTGRPAVPAPSQNRRASG